MADEEQKTEHINLKVAGQDGSVVQFKIKKVCSNTGIHPQYKRTGDRFWRWTGRAIIFGKFGVFKAIFGEIP